MLPIASIIVLIAVIKAFQYEPAIGVLVGFFGFVLLSYLAEKNKITKRRCTVNKHGRVVWL